MTKRFGAIVIVSNVIMGFFLFLSNQLVLLNLKGYIVQDVSIGQIGIVGAQPESTPIATVIDYAPVINYPFLVFLISLAVNLCFLIMLFLRKKQTKPNHS